MTRRGGPVHVRPQRVSKPSPGFARFPPWERGESGSEVARVDVENSTQQAVAPIKHTPFPSYRCRPERSGARELGVVP